MNSESRQYAFLNLHEAVLLRTGQILLHGEGCDKERLVIRSNIYAIV